MREQNQQRGRRRTRCSSLAPRDLYNPFPAQCRQGKMCREAHCGIPLPQRSTWAESWIVLHET